MPENNRAINHTQKSTKMENNKINNLNLKDEKYIISIQKF